MKFIAIFGILVSYLLGEQTLKIATYNVENLFDLHRSGQEYKEYIPNTKSMWNQKNYTKKLKNISRVIKDINADIIALEEIESLQALKDLRLKLKQNGLYYQYFAITSYKKTTIKVAFLSKIPFTYAHEIAVTPLYKYRNILEVKFNIDNKELYLLINHWKSKAGPESMRIVSAKRVRKRIQELGTNKNIIVLGDFNSDYEEYKIFLRKRKHNNTNGITGINHILGTKNHTQDAKNTNYNNNELYNLWYDTTKENRYSYIYRGKKEALDNILISSSLLNQTTISYKYNSILSFKPSYLLKGKNIYRWQMRRKRPRIHKGKGYSDHLAVSAEFLLY